MRSWKELAIEFRSLASSLSETRLDIQWGASGVHSRLAGMAGNPSRHRFEILAAIAGQRFRESKSASHIADVLSAPSDFDVWALGLKHLGRSFRSGMIGEQMTADGQSAGFIYTGTVSAPAESSANLCLIIEASEAEHEEKALWDLAETAGATNHLRKAYDALQAEVPDLAAVAREAVSALEAVARTIVGNQPLTLGECIADLRRRGALHPTLAKTLEGVWGFSNGGLNRLAQQ